MKFKELLDFEKKYNLWNYELFDYPLWIHCREPLLSSSMMAERHIRRPKLWEMIKSFSSTVKFLLTQYRYDKVFFLMERAELLEVYYQEKNLKKILFLNPEQERVYKGDDAISSDFFSLLRFISRKMAYLIFRSKYKQITDKLEDKNLNKYIKDALGDALFLKLLSILLSKKNEKIYTGAVVPIGEKFVNLLNSIEVQHGVIHPEHIGYIGIPKVKNRLMLYASRYKELLHQEGYKGQLIVNNYKKNFFEKNSKRHFPIVIYTQPTIEMQKGIEEFFKEYKINNIYIQRHPKDYFEYEIDTKYFVTATSPIEVDYPIMYLSSVMENFTNYDKNCYIYNLKSIDIDVDEFIKIYTQGSKSKIFIRDNLAELCDDIYSTKKIKITQF